MALEEELLIKYVDGNVKPQNPDGTFKHNAYTETIPDKIEFPGYSDHWKEMVVEDYGSVLEVKE